MAILLALVFKNISCHKNITHLYNIILSGNYNIYPKVYLHIHVHRNHL